MKRPWYLQILRWARFALQIIDQIEEKAAKPESGKQQPPGERG